MLTLAGNYRFWKSRDFGSMIRNLKMYRHMQIRSLVCMEICNDKTHTHTHKCMTYEYKAGVGKAYFEALDQKHLKTGQVTLCIDSEQEYLLPPAKYCRFFWYTSDLGTPGADAALQKPLISHNAINFFRRETVSPASVWPPPSQKSLLNETCELSKRLEAICCSAGFLLIPFHSVQRLPFPSQAALINEPSS